MNRHWKLPIGVLLILIGGLWTLQGLGYVGGSMMTRVVLWAVVGPVVALVGLLSCSGRGTRQTDRGSALGDRGISSRMVVTTPIPLEGGSAA